MFTVETHSSWKMTNELRLYPVMAIADYMHGQKTPLDSIYQYRRNMEYMSDQYITYVLTVLPPDGCSF